MDLNTLFRNIPRYVASLILLQTLLFKFGIGGQTFLNESIALFSSLTIALFGDSHLEGLFRIGTGILEFIASVLMVIPKTAVYGGVMGVGLMTGAILSHIFLIGVTFGNDGGKLISLAVIVLVCSLKIVYDEKDRLPKII